MKACVGLIGLLWVSLCQSQPAATLPVAKGVYRLPYQDGIDVRITNDHSNHPASRNRLDMGGRNLPANIYLIVAAADGWIRLVEESNVLWCPRATASNPDPCDGEEDCCERDDSSCNSDCANNFLWMEHPNGEWSKYSHLRTGSVTFANLEVGDYVQSGTILGVEGRVGFAGNYHLHFEVADPDRVPGSFDPSDPSDPNHFIGSTGFLEGNEGDVIDYNRQNRIPYFCRGNQSAQLLFDGDLVVADTCDAQCNTDTSQLFGTIPDDAVFYRQVTDTITTPGAGFTVNAGGGASIRAGDSITLNPGVTIQGDGYFSASIAGCDTPGR